ncbi:MAG: amidohydrolase family protein, partial [Acidobacteriota bacterium]|nr:amidohydrolase family protein [Acidobacteriota bacterium]
MIDETNQQVDEKNRWRTETPGHVGWQRTARPGDPNRYLMISADCHVNEPSKLWWERIDEKFRNRLPHIEVDAKGDQWMVVEGYQRSRVRKVSKDDAPKGGEDRLRGNAGRDPLDRIRDHARDGIDAEIVFPNKGLAMFATQDAEFGAAQCRVWNDWAWEVYGQYNDFMSPMAAIMTADLNLATAEIKRVAKIGFRGLTLPCKPVWGAHDARHPNYNLQMFDPLWALIQDCDLPVTFHVSTGRDPRAARSDGGAVINYAAHSLSPTIEPVASLCASGVIERFPKLRFAAIESGIGWVPWALTAMDEAYRKHHLWAFPKLKHLPSDYFRSNGAASFQEDPAGLQL